MGLRRGRSGSLCRRREAARPRASGELAEWLTSSELTCRLDGAFTSAGGTGRGKSVDAAPQELTGAREPHDDCTTRQSDRRAYEVRHRGLLLLDHPQPHNRGDNVDAAVRGVRRGLRS